jgi:hypothetical protein
MADLSKIILPNNTTVTLKDNSQARSDHRHYESDLIPLVHKTYASTSYYATNSSWDNSTWYFMSVKPNSWYTPWKVRFKVHSFCPAYANVDSITWATVCGRADSVIYANWNERYDPAHYYTTYYVLKKAGFDAGYGHAIGISILYGTGYTTAAYYRTFEVDYFECENCTVTILDTPVKWVSWPGTGTTNYTGLNSMNAVDRGLQESGDADTIDSRMSYFCGRTGSKGIWAGSLFMEDSSNTYQNICTATDGTATNSNRTTGTKIANTSGFKPFTKVYYCGGNYNPNSDINGWGAVYSECGLFDARYAFNVTLTANSLTPYKPIYLVGTINSSDGLFYLDSIWWTQTPTTTSKVYVLVGSCYDSTTSNCRINLYEHNTWYKYDGSKLVEISGDARSVNGYTVNKSVPSNAVFTDTTYTLGTSGNNVTLTPAGGSAQSVTAPYATSAGSATKATQDESGNNIKATYANSFSISDHTITLKNKNGTSLGTVTVPDNNTTYTFANGTNGFTVTPSGGTAQTVTVTPSITNNITGSGTSGYLTKFNGTNTITNGPQLGSSTTTYLNNAGSWATPPDTKNTAGSTDTSSKIFLIGATSQAANPQTYSDNEVYATSGVLTTKSVQVGGGSATMQYNTTTQAIDFVFT